MSLTDGTGGYKEKEFVASDVRTVAGWLKNAGDVRFRGLLEHGDRIL